MPENWAADRLITRAATLGATVDWRRHQLTLGVARHDLDLADPASSIADGPLWRLHAGLRANWITPQGHEVALRGDWQRNDRAAPLQSRHWLGGAQSLRGYPVRELEGDDAALATLDLRGGFDPLRALHVPLLSRLGLQPIAFADWGRTTGVDRETRAGAPTPASASAASSARPASAATCASTPPSRSSTARATVRGGSC